MSYISYIASNLVCAVAHFGKCHIQCVFGGQLNGKQTNDSEFPVFMEAEDSSEGLVEVVTHEKV